MRKREKLGHDAVDASDREILNQTAELGYFSLSLSQFRGKLGWVTWVIMIVQTLLFLAGVWCATHFFAATDTLLAVKWGLSGAVLLLAGMQLKLSLMPQMQADRVLREVKRVELMLAARR